MIYTVIVAKCSWIVGACVADDGCHIVAHTAQIFLFGLHEFVLYVPKATKTKVDLDTLISFRYSRPHPHRKTKQNNKSARHQKHPVDLNIGSTRIHNWYKALFNQMPPETTCCFLEPKCLSQ